MMSKWINAGELRHRITIEQGEVTSSGAGQQKRTWIPFAENVPAKVEPLSGREYFNAAQVKQGEVSHKVTMRYLPGVVSTMRIKFGDRYFAIIVPLNIEERNRKLEIMCLEVPGEEIE